MASLAWAMYNMTYLTNKSGANFNTRLMFGIRLARLSRMYNKRHAVAKVGIDENAGKYIASPSQAAQNLCGSSPTLGQIMKRFIRRIVDRIDSVRCIKLPSQTYIQEPTRYVIVD